MASKPDQMQIEKQKAAEIQRTQQAAEQTQNMQQPVQQNAQTQQNVQQFWTEDMELQEQIPMQQENLTEEMESAYEKVHGQKMGVKSRIWRTERTTKKKRARRGHIKKEEYRFLHNRIVMAETSGLNALAEQKPELAGMLRQWMDLSGTKKSMQDNREMVEKFSGDRNAEFEGILSMVRQFDKLDLGSYKNMSDENMSKNYYRIKQQAEQAGAIRNLTDYMLKNGGSIDEQLLLRVRVKAQYLSEYMSHGLRSRISLMESPYYHLLRQSDTNKLSKEELTTRISNSEGKLKEYYFQLRNLLSVKQSKIDDPGQYLKDKNVLNMEKMLVDKSRKIYRQEQERLAKYEREKQEDPKRAAALAERRQRIDQANHITKTQAARDNNLRNDIFENIPEYENNRQQMAQMNEEMPRERRLQRFRNFSSQDPEVRFREYDAVFDELLNEDISKYQIATDEQILESAAKNKYHVMYTNNAYIQVWEMVKTAMRDEGMKIPQERLEAIWKSYCFFMDVANLYRTRMKIMCGPFYGDVLPDEEPDTEEKVMKCTEKDPSEAAYYQNFTLWAGSLERLNMTSRTEPLTDVFARYKPGPMIF